jgi:DNA mismatch repair protein MutL
VAAADAALTTSVPAPHRESPEPAPRIRRLPDHLVNKIAAGEVIERPASAVKELVENALDAGATTVTVELGDGGAALIRVTDDGVGMTAAELPLALERHATSKLARDEDLEAIATLGFRGEALSAICAVSRFVVTSRARGAPEGTRLAGEGGASAQWLAVPADAGTTVEIRDLFFNTPARLKFLKSPAAELAASLRALTHLAIAHPGAHLRVAHHGRAVLAAPAAPDGRRRIGALWGWDVAARLLAFDRSEHGLRVHGLASPPDFTRGSREDVVVVVNGRPVRDPALFQAVIEAYRPLLSRDRFPLVVAAVDLAASDVDVNVHPTKAWVRFRHPRLVQEMLITALREALRRPAVVPAVAARDAGATAAGGLDATGTADAGTTATAGDAAAGPGTGVESQGALFAEPAAHYAPARFGRVLGQIQETFILSTTDDEVFFLDQHVAHERVLFERLRADVAAGVLASQALLFPEPLDLSPAARALLERWRRPLEALGFAFDGFGGQAIILRAVPSLLKGDEPRRLIEAAVDDLGGPKAGAPAIDRALAFVACRAAVKANTPLAREEMERLVADLATTETPYFCPHGRPIVSRVSVADIRRELKRNW